MGKLDFDNSSSVSQPVKNFLNTNIETYIDKAAEYSKYLEGSPNFVTYYSIDMENSTTDPGLGTIIEQVGRESPIKYNKINNLPIYQVGESQPSFDYSEDTGLDGSMNGTAVIPPNLIQPQPNDYLTFTYHQRNSSVLKLFRVSSVEMSTLNTKTYYQITYVEDNGVSLSYLEGRQKSEEFEAIYENIGTGKLPIVKETTYRFSVELQKVIDKISNLYVDDYWSEHLNSFLYKSGEFSWIYDNYLHYFINQHDLFIYENTLLSNILVENHFPLTERDFRSSFYYKVINNHDLTTNYKFNNIPNDRLFSGFYGTFQNITYQPAPVNSDKPDDKCCCKNKSLSLFDFDLSDFADNDIVDLSSLSGIDPVSQVLLLYMQEKTDLLNLELLQELVDYLMDQPKSINLYIKIPVLIYILRKIHWSLFYNEEKEIFV